MILSSLGEKIAKREGESMKKWILIGGTTLVVIIIVVLVVGISNLGPIIKRAVNTYGPTITKTEVRLSGVGISILSGEAKLKGFYLGNPEGFKSPEAMTVASIFVDLDEKSITSDPVIIDKIEVVRPEITYEKAGRTDNFKTILNNVESSVRKGSAAKQQSGKKDEGKKLIIKNFIIKDAKVDLSISAVGGQSLSASASLQDIHLKNIGEKRGGASPEQVFKEVFAILYKEMTSPAVTAALNEQLKELGSSVEIETPVGKTDLGSATDKVKGMFGK